MGGPIGAVMLFISIKQLVNRAVPVDFYCNYDTFKKYFHKINKLIHFANLVFVTCLSDHGKIFAPVICDQISK